ncbi:MAG TPA: methylated-DNA--[protein]-cysteine S-methyltransferase [Nocardioidaceae bacterium]|nr:methylated-DNA--[protein]-cysteine S-methyltransferase [Nocardioidaceae bacterium]
MTAWTVMPSPVGELLLQTDGTHLTAIRFEPWEQPDGARDDGHPLLVDARAQLLAYFAGERESFDLVLAARGTDFQQRVWQQLRRIPYGSTVTYGEIARALGLVAGASRAVGLANGRNPLPIVVPCHRVIGSNGTLTGYAGGVDRKQTLLGLEKGALC